jgi:hypothetical protein
MYQQKHQLFFRDIRSRAQSSPAGSELPGTTELFIFGSLLIIGAMPVESASNPRHADYDDVQMN